MPEMAGMAKQKPSLCDLVLEGGVTSGVIYLGAIAELSRQYQFKNLGGTSSGAISAAAAAIAQRSKLELLKKSDHERKDPPDKPFTELLKFPAELAEQSKSSERTALFQLFQPQQATRKSYRILAAVLERWAIDKRGRAIANGVKEAVFQFPLAVLVGALPGLWLLGSSIHSILQICKTNALSLTCAISSADAAFSLTLAAVGGVLVVSLWTVMSTARALKENHFGLCNGMQGVDSTGDAALTVKMHELFNKLLGRNPHEDPVTFAHLWGKDAAEFESSAAAGVAPAEREIDLQVIASAINLRRPFRLPNDQKVDPLHEFFYDPEEWKDFFPIVVMNWLKKYDRLQGMSGVVSNTGAPLRALPPPALWPVVVPVRMSCAFPGLLSAVPMYYFEGKQQHDDHLRDADGESATATPSDGRFVAAKVYFCDGGITSNCPVQLFDSALPSHPTFAIALENLASSKSPCHRVHLPSSNDMPKSTVRTTTSPWSFASAIIRTGIDWQDGLQRALPGHRERIVTVGLKPEEGGLNLAMTPQTIRLLPSLGMEAGRRLVDDFNINDAEQRSSGWDRHRWLRLRTTLAAMQSYLSQLHTRRRRSAAERADSEEPWVLNEREMLDLEPLPEPIFADSDAVKQAKALLDGLSDLAETTCEWKRSSLSDNAPRPTPKLRMSPPW